MADSPGSKCRHEFLSSWYGRLNAKLRPLPSEPCQKLEAEFELAAEVLKERGITSISIDCTTEAKLCSNHTITSYPALRIFRGPGNFTRYRQGRKAAK
jgi:hypothetical protein